MKLFFTTLLVSFFASTSLVGQITKQRQVPRETIALHVNTTLFLTGEYMYYRVHCTKEPFARNFESSLIAYVELISENLESVFKHKIVLEKGNGHSDFFIPNSITSGNYKLIAYTQEMLNAASGQFVETNINIINPYQATQNNIVTSQASNDSFNKTSLNTCSKNVLGVRLDKQFFKPREKVSVTILNNRAEMGYGTYAVSVKRVDGLPLQPSTSKSTNTYTAKIPFIPETKGSILSGILLSTETGSPIANEALAISIPGNDFFFMGAITDAAGTFQFELPAGIEGETAYMRPFSPLITKYTIQKTSKEHIDYSQLSFSKFKITPAMKDDIVNRSIANQIENAYFSQKPDTSTTRANKKSFLFYEVGARYNLDDYTRFRTLEETFTEFVPSVFVKNKKGKKEIHVFEKKFSAPTDDLPLLFVDGLWVRDPEQLLQLDARTFETLKVIRRGYQFGGVDYFGVLLLTSKDVTKNIPTLASTMKAVTLFKPQPYKTYYQQQYDEVQSNEFEKIPDYRHQLLWHPMYPVNATLQNLVFYTSDVSGTYEIVVSGTTNNGENVCITEQFTVTNTIN